MSPLPNTLPPLMPGVGPQTGYPDQPIPIDRVPPRTRLVWTPTGRGSNFGGYNLYRRPRALPVSPWLLVGQILPYGPSATSGGAGAYASNATVEAQHTSFVDYEAGWGVAGTRWAPGWDYDVRVVDLASGVESPIGTQVSLGDAPPASQNAWLTCNSAPYLNCPVHVLENDAEAASQSADMTSRSSMFGNVLSYDVHGRDGSLTRTRLGVPPRTKELTWELLGNWATDVFDVHKAASLSGRQLALLESRGDRYYGSLKYPDVTVPSANKISAKSKFDCVAPVPAPANYNEPCRIVFNGSSQYASTSGAFNPGTAPWALMVCGMFNNRQNDVFLSDGFVDSGGAPTNGSFGFWCPTVGTFRFSARGGSATVTLSSTANWYDGNVHVAVVTFDGTTWTLWIDGVVTVTATTNTGSISNAVPLIAAADNGGAANFSASALQAWGYWSRTLTATEVLALSRYLLVYSGYRLPYGALAFHHAADTRCWNGSSTTLASLADLGVPQSASLVASPTTRGIPWTLRELDRQW